MTKADSPNGKSKRAGQKANEALEEVAAHPWIERIARFGYATKGVVYIVVGGLATMAALGLGGQTTDTHGALETIEAQPFGRLMLGTVAFGLVGYVVWRWLQAIADTDDKGDDLKGYSIRFGYICSGLAYAGLAFSAARILFDAGGTNSSSDVQEHWTARLMSVPMGRWLVAAAGLGVVVFGIYQIYKGIKAKFRKRLKLAEMSPAQKRWATLGGSTGYAARGVVFCIIGGFLIRAAIDYNPSEAQGLDEVLQSLARPPFGPWVLFVVATGLIIYGLYMLVESRFRRINGS